MPRLRRLNAVPLPLMAVDFAWSLLVFLALAFGLAWPLAARLPLAAAEKIVASAVLSLVGTFAFAWIVFGWALPPATLWVLPAIGAAGLALGAGALAEAWRDTDGCAVIVGQLIVTAWCVGWLATIATYAGGGWSGDWFEHWERARFFLDHQPITQKFLGHDSLTARPPLANVVTAVFLTLTRADFAHYQLFSTLLATLVFLPAALLARRFGRNARAIAICAALFLVNPLLVQNATFAWTKLPAALFVLAALYFFLRAQERGAPLAAPLLCATSLGAGLITHYSAGPYAVMLALSWLGLGWAQRDERDWQRATALAALAGAAVLALWFGWAIATYGAHETFFSNSSVTTAAQYHGSQLGKILRNLRDTFVPHFIRSPDPSFIAQRNLLGRWSDWFFQNYQLNLPLACGSLAWLVIIRELVRARRGAGIRDRYFWGSLFAGVVVLGVGTHGARDEWGLAHICLQALVLLAVAFLAARWGHLSRAWRVALLVGAAIDLAGGIVLHGAMQSLAFGRWLAPGAANDIAAGFSLPTKMNLNGKIVNHLAFFSDVFAAPLGLVLALLLALLALAVVGAWPRPAPARRPLAKPPTR